MQVSCTMECGNGRCILYLARIGPMWKVDTTEEGMLVTLSTSKKSISKCFLKHTRNNYALFIFVSGFAKIAHSL